MSRWPAAIAFSFPLVCPASEPDLTLDIRLDPASREEILRALRTYEGAVVLVTHDEGAVEALEPERVLLLPDAVEDLWNPSYLDLVTLA